MEYTVLGLALSPTFFIKYLLISYAVMARLFMAISMAKSRGLKRFFERQLHVHLQLLPHSTKTENAAVNKRFFFQELILACPTDLPFPIATVAAIFRSVSGNFGWCWFGGLLQETQPLKTICALFIFQIS